jgi:hypothetical protein
MNQSHSIQEQTRAHKSHSSRGTDIIFGESQLESIHRTGWLKEER